MAIEADLYTTRELATTPAATTADGRRYKKRVEWCQCISTRDEEFGLHDLLPGPSGIWLIAFVASNPHSGINVNSIDSESITVHVTCVPSDPFGDFDREIC